MQAGSSARSAERDPYAQTAQDAQRHAQAAVAHAPSSAADALDAAASAADAVATGASSAAATAVASLGREQNAQDSDNEDEDDEEEGCVQIHVVPAAHWHSGACQVPVFLWNKVTDSWCHCQLCAALWQCSLHCRRSAL
jgi:hypothetical protein